VRVGGEVVVEPTARVSAGTEVAFEPQAQRLAERGSRILARGDVVHADAHVIVVAKPAGVSTVPYGDEAGDTLEARVRTWLGRQGQAPRGARPSLGVVHRLDKETSGLLVFTRTWLAKQSLTSQFRRHSVHRRYLAIAHGDVRPRTIRSLLLEDRGDGLRGSARGAMAQRANAAQEAVTHVERLEPLDGATLVACRLETGRTHQIRIHLSEAGHPLVGERVYVRGYAGVLVAAPRLMLHAAELGFVHPATGRQMQWELPMPEDMAAVLERLRI
jgi:23S rRNA pseudouridine1911/1915/1917 synthase